MRTKDAKSFLAVEAPSKLVTVPPDLSVRKALELMRELKIHHLIVSRDERCLGIVEAAALALETDAGQWPGGTHEVTVGEVMRLGVPVIDESTDVKTALAAMLERGFNAVPFTKDGKLAGILTQSDMLRLLEKLVRNYDRTERLKAEGEAWLASPLLQSIVKTLADAGI